MSSISAAEELQIETILDEARPTGWKRRLRNLFFVLIPTSLADTRIGAMLRTAKIWSAQRFIVVDEPFHSQYGQDVIAAKLLMEIKDATYLDIGAHNGLNYSNTHVLERVLGLKGICVEPNPAIYDALVKERSAHCHCVVISTGDSEAVRFVAASGRGSMLSHIEGSANSADKMVSLENMKAEGRADYEVIEVPVRSISEILMESELDKIDFVSIDVEGAEMAVLSQIDLAALGTSVLTVESNGDPLELLRHVTSQGFELHSCLGGDLLFVSPNRLDAARYESASRTK